MLAEHALAENDAGLRRAYRRAWVAFGKGFEPDLRAEEKGAYSERLETPQGRNLTPHTVPRRHMGGKKS